MSLEHDTIQTLVNRLPAASVAHVRLGLLHAVRNAIAYQAKEVAELDALAQELSAQQQFSTW